MPQTGNNYQQGWIVRGDCPMGCGQTLLINSAGFIRCAAETCPRPTAVSELLTDVESEHIVMLQAGGNWTLRHPLLERIETDLFSCHIADHVLADVVNDNAPEPGVYRIVYVGHDPVSTTLHAPMLRWEKLPETTLTCGR